MNAWDVNDWQRTLAATQEYLHNRIIGNGCDRGLIEAWRRFYFTHEPIVRAMVSRSGVEHANACIEAIWLDILIEVPKLPTPLTRDAFLYWLSQVVRTKASLLRRLSGDDATAGEDGISEFRAETFLPEFQLSVDSSNHESAVESLVDRSAHDAADFNSRLFEMRLVEERSIDEVAQALGATVEQVAVRERQMLRSILSILINLDASHSLTEPEELPSRSA